jgi:hypothetical protein
MARAVRRFSQKERYIAIASDGGAGAGLPLVATAVLRISDALADGPPRWPWVLALLQRDSTADLRALVVKPCVSGGGDGIAVVEPGDEAALEDALRLVARYAPTGLLQEWIEPALGEVLPASVGASLFIVEDGSVRIVGVARQLFGDRFLHTFVASDWDAAVELRVLDQVGEALLQRGAALAASGLRGPFGLDLMLDRRSGTYVDVGDLNPRLTGAGPLWQCRDLLESHGVVVERMTMLPVQPPGPCDLVDVAHRLDESDALLTASRPSGVWLVPSLAGSTHIQAFAVNADAATRRSLLTLLAQALRVRTPPLFGDAGSG